MLSPKFLLKRSIGAPLKMAPRHVPPLPPSYATALHPIVFEQLYLSFGIQGPNDCRGQSYF